MLWEQSTGESRVGVETLMKDSSGWLREYNSDFWAYLGIIEFIFESIFEHNWVHIWKHLRAYLRSESCKAECELKRWCRIAQVYSLNRCQTHSTILEEVFLLLLGCRSWVVWFGNGFVLYRYDLTSTQFDDFAYFEILWTSLQICSELRDAIVRIILSIASHIHLHWLCHNISNYKMESEKLCLQWNDFQKNLNTAFRNLQGDTDFNDVTLACEDGTQVEAHKVVLATSSPVFQNLLRKNKHNHPLIYMRGMKSHDLQAIVDFLYCGEANVYQENLDSFLVIAEELQLKGLMGKSEGKLDQEVFPTTDPVNPTKVTTKNRNEKIERTNDVHPPRIDPSTRERTVAIKGDISEDLSQLDEQIKSMMEMSQNLVSSGKYKAHTCKACGKEGMRNDIRKHIEANHLEGLSFPCNLCEKSCRSRNALWMHKHKNHWFQSNIQDEGLPPQAQRMCSQKNVIT